MDNVWLASALWIGLALVASIVSMRVAISVALIEIMVGAVAGNIVGAAAGALGEFSRRIRRHPAHFPGRRGDRPAQWCANILVEHVASAS